MLWTPTSVTFYFNGMETGSYNVTINEPMYMMLDFDVAGPNDWGGPPKVSTPTTAQFDISSVRVYQLS